MKKYFTYILFFAVIFMTVNARSQSTEKLISGNFNNLKFKDFAEQIEANTKYFFYYDLSQLDSFIVDIAVQEKPLKEVLSFIFSGTEFSFAIDHRNYVFVLKGKEIQADLPDGFFDRNIEPATSREIVVYDYFNEAEKEKLNAAEESKVYDIGIKTNTIKQGNATLAGSVRDIKTGEPIIGASIYIEEPKIGVVTNQFGYYSFTLPRGKHKIKIRSLGMRDTERQIILYSDGKLDIQMQDNVLSLKEVVIKSEKDVNIAGLQMGVEKLNMKTIKQVPTAFGEADILRVVLSLPGVKSVGEATTGFNVRGGAVDQNLILFNDATVYNPSHLFGFFSAFNPDILKNVELYKSSIPARYGGRLSSVLEVTTREGNKKELAGAGGIGLLTGRLMLEGPIIKDKMSIMVAGRSNYSNWVLSQIRNKDYRNSKASFYDINLQVSHEVNENNSLFLTGYVSSDEFKFRSDTTYSYRNENATLKWKHIFNNKLYSVLTGGYSKYKFSVASDGNEVNAYKLSFDVNQANFRADFNFFPSTSHTIDFGITSTYYKLHPGSFLPNSSQSLVVPDVLEPEQAIESALFIGDTYNVNPRLSLNIGLRYSMYNYLGPKTVYSYPAQLPKEEANILDTISYSSNDFIKTYQGPEYRLSARYALSERASVKLSYNSLRQFIHMVSNTTAISPTDIWKLSDPNIRPQLGDQLSFGYYRNFRMNSIETSVEVYYKRIDNYLDYKSGAVLIMNHHLETDVVNTEGKAYGAEFLIKKLTGKLNGWMSYTWSRTLLRMNDPSAGELINNGDWYPGNFDKPHDFTMIGNYRLSHRFSISLNFTYSTGRPITLPLAKFNLGDSERVYYSERNQFRIPDYYRADFSMNVEGNHKIRKLAHSSWTFAIYNITGRKNPYSVYFTTENGKIKGYQLSIFGQPIPTITYNFRF